jgi:hypothetical protein
MHDIKIYECPGEDQLLLSLVSNQPGRISIRDAINRLVHLRGTAKKFAQIKSPVHHPLETDPNAEVKMLEGLFMDKDAELVTSNDTIIVNALKNSFRSNIPSRYNREPVI